jgi:hypothetical protein
MQKSVRGFVLVVCVVATLSSGRAGAQSLPSGWSTSDIGNVGAAGSASGSGGTFNVAGAGADIWGSADAFRYVYTTLTGNGSITAQVSSLQFVNDWTKAGVMMRASLTAGSAHAMMLVSANKGLAFQRRLTAGGLSTHTAGPASKAPYYVRLTRTDNTITAYASTAGSTWAVVGSSTYTSLPATLFVGLAVSSHVYGTVAAAAFSATSITGSTAPPPTTQTVETIVFLRHGEKPSGGYGQITCQGLRRALALPPVLTGRFGKPNFIFAPNPVPKVGDVAGNFYYVRPLATIEPTAISLGMPVHAGYGFTDVAGIKAELTNPAYASSTIFVAWEHLKLVEIVQSIMNTYGGGQTVPAWPSGDYDSLYVVTLTNSGGTITATFDQQVEGLNNLPTSCPQ